MIFDNERQKQIILELLKASNIPGTLLDEIFEFKMQVVSGKVEQTDKDDKK